MSFIVKGKKIPNTCWDCPLADVEQGWCDSDMVTIIDFNERPVECPLVALPDKHGRLVEFIDVVTTLDEDSGTEEVCVGDIMRAYYEMRNAPTIVESEDSGCQNT